jgi:hypothetical protein
MSKEESIIIPAYRRMMKAAISGRGVTLSANEVFTIVTFDDAITQAVYTEDEKIADGKKELDALMGRCEHCAMPIYCGRLCAMCARDRVKAK